MITHIWINGKKWDLYSDTDIKYTLQVNDVSELKDRQASFTNSFSCPKTPNNIQIADGLGATSDSSRFPYEKRLCQVKVDGFDLIARGWVNITETDDEYKIFIYSGIIEFFKTIENVNIGDLDLSEIDHVKNLDTVLASFSNPNYRYLITDYNGQTHYGPNDEIINIDYLVPSALVKYLWDKIHSTYQFTYSGSIFDSSDFKNLFISYPKFIAVNETEDPLEGEFNRYIDLFTSAGNEDRYYRTLFFSGLEDSKTFTAAEKGNYQIVIDIENTFQNDLEATVRYLLSINQEDLPLIDRTNSILLQEKSAKTDTFQIKTVIPLNAGDVISFYDYMKMNGYLKWNTSIKITIAKLIPGTTSFTKAFSDFSISDFIKEVVNHFGLTIFPNESTKELKYLTISERMNFENTIDWSEKYLSRKNEEYVYSYYAQKNIFSFKYDDSEASFNNGSININNANIADKKVIFTSRTFSPEKDLTEFFTGTSGVQLVEVFKLYNKEVNRKEGETEIKYKGLENRFHFLREKTLATTVKIGSEALIQEETVYSIPIATFDGLDWRTLLNKNYNEFGRILNDSRLHNIELNLNTIDCLQLDLAALYYFKQEQQYYILNRLNFNSDRATGEFVRVKNQFEKTVIEEPEVETYIKISWLDGTTTPKAGKESQIMINIASMSYPNTNELISFDWERFDGSTWNSLGAGNSPYSASLIEGVQKFRMKAIAEDDTIVYSNILQYDRLVIDCRSYRATSIGNSGDDLTAIFMDCEGAMKSLSTYATSSNQFLELSFCANAGTVSLNRGALEDLGPC